MIVKIDKLSHDFKGIAKVNDKVTFINNALPGEVVDIKITNEKKNMNIAKVVNVIEESNDRIVLKCPYYDVCGGCDISYIGYDKSLIYKKEIVKDILERYANITINPSIEKCDNDYFYRNKITLKVKNGKLALVKDGTNDLVNIDKCLLVNDNINNVISILNSINLDGIDSVIICGTKEIMVIIDGKCDINNIIDLLKDKVKSIIYNDKVVYGSEYIIIDVKDKKYAIYPKSFFQVNTFMISKIYDKVKEYASTGNKLLDLYCGAGTIGIYLADNFKKVYGIEVNENSIKSANVNKKINNVNNISFKCAKASNITKLDYDVVVVDPPRNGLDKITISKLISSNIKRIVYVSCNPITLARDLNILKEKYILKDISLFDNFPNTKHVESIIILEKK